MLDQIARHAGVDLTIRVNGDLQVDEHHTIEDTGLALGEAFKLALGDKRGIERYGYSLPMDDCLEHAGLYMLLHFLLDCVAHNRVPFRIRLVHIAASCRRGIAIASGTKSCSIAQPQLSLAMLQYDKAGR